MRVRNDAYDLSLTTDEEMLFAALWGVPMTEGFDDSAKGYAQVVIPAELVGEFGERCLDEFLAKARAQADKWLTEPELAWGWPVPHLHRGHELFRVHRLQFLD